jgi:hypothetical protein
MTYVNDSSGLEPSVYGGGGSPSSTLFPDDSPLLSLERAALVSAITEGGGFKFAAAEGYSSNGGAGAKAGKEAVPDSVTEMSNASCSASGDA